MAMLKTMLIIIVLLLLSCDETNNESTTLTVQFTLNGKLPIKSAFGMLYSNSSDTTTFKFNVTDTAGEYQFTNVNPGNWNIELSAYSDTINVDSLLRYYIKDSKTIIDGVANSAKLVLEPVSGKLNINVNL
jgi:hypothetical protein